MLAPILEFKPFRTELIEFELLNQNQSRLRGSSMASPTSTPASPDSDTPKVRSGSGGEALLPVTALAMRLWVVRALPTQPPVRLLPSLC